MAPPRDLREWIALLEREGELRRISAEVDPDLEITEIIDRVVKAGGPALLFENPKGSQHPLLINQFGTERRMCMALGVETLDDAAAKLGDILDMQPPEGLREKVQGAPEAQVRRRLAPEDGLEGRRARRSCSRGTTSTSGCFPIQRCWPGDPAPFITLPAVITKDPNTGGAQRRHVPDAGDRPLVDLHALADAQGRPSRPARGGGRTHPGRCRDRARPGHRLFGERAAPEAPRRADARRLPPRRAGRARARARRSTSRFPRTRRSSSRAGSRRTTSASRAPSATTRATTRTPSRSRSSASRR